MKIVAISGLGEQPIDTTGVQPAAATGAWIIILGTAALMFFLTLHKPARRRR
jgi:hypothetical protein